MSHDLSDRRQECHAHTIHEQSLVHALTVSHYCSDMVAPNLVRTLMKNSLLESAADEHRECKDKGEWRHDLEPAPERCGSFPRRQDEQKQHGKAEDEKRNARADSRQEDVGC